jgi:dTDP-D-glucose 4,6-dehydratase
LQIADLVATNLGCSGPTNIDFIADRPFNDFRYAVNCEKMKSLGWKQRRRLEDKIPELLSWYRENIARYDEMFEMKSEPFVTA